MAIDTTEKTFESEIEADLIQNGGYVMGDPKAFDRELALDTATLFKFIQTTQPQAWEELVRRHKGQHETKFIKRLVDELSHRGMLDVLRHGVKDLGVQIALCFFKPANLMNQTTVERYKGNILTVIRQVYYTATCKNSVDMVLLINGLPVVTLELKNQLTGQNFRNSINQYKNDRSPKDLLFSFKRRALVHFAVDTDEAWMTTKIDGSKTHFLPFNKGNNSGAGNPVNPNSFRTAYLWDNILTKDSLLDIIQRFMLLEQQKDNKTDKTIKETMIFPRYHQLDAVRKLLKDAKANGSGHNYLIQHSAGSGKSNSIAWLSHHLSTLHDDNNKAVFNSVVVITDRKVLDKQLQNSIYQFEHTPGVVQKIDHDSKQLAKALNANVKIVITTLQKFPFILDKVKSLAGKKFAVIVDEAHSSQTGKDSEKMKQTLSAVYENGNNAQEAELQRVAETEAKIEAETPDAEDEIDKSV